MDGLKPVIPLVQFEQTKRTVEEFLKANGEGEKLQALLQEYANEKENWVSWSWIKRHVFQSHTLLLVISIKSRFIHSFVRSSYAIQLMIYKLWNKCIL